jgi:hypothetical protein
MIQLSPAIIGLETSVGGVTDLSAAERCLYLDYSLPTSSRVLVIRCTS